jgi:hypothetical protein
MQRGYKVPRQFTVAMKLLVPTSKMVKGTRVDTFSDPEESRTFFGSFRTYGGSENLSNEVLTIFDTAIIDTWYNPDIKQDCRILVLETGKEYNIISVPENIDMRHKYMQFKVQRVGGRP